MPRTQKNQQETQEDRRRYNGEGSIFLRGKSWCAVVSLGDKPDGSRLRKTFSAPTQKEVQAKVRAAILAHEQGLPAPDEATTVKKLMEDWLAVTVKPSVRPRTYDSYAMIVHAHIIPALGKQKVAQLDARTVQQFINDKAASGLSAQTVIYLRGVLRNALNQAVVWNLVSRNVVLSTKPPKKKEAEKPQYSDEQARELITIFETHRHGPLYTTLLGLGLRLGEGLGLRWSDVVLNPGEGKSPYLRVQFQLQHIAGKYQLTEPKSSASRRIIYLPASVVQVLRKHKEHQENVLKPLAGTRWENNWNLVFTNINGGPLDDARVRQHFKVLLAKHDIPPIRLHDLRHMCATLLISRGVHAKVVQEMLGHGSFLLTMNTYSHVVVNDAKAAADALDLAFGHHG